MNKIKVFFKVLAFVCIEMVQKKFKLTRKLFFPLHKLWPKASTIIKSMYFVYTIYFESYTS